MKSTLHVFFLTILCSPFFVKAQCPAVSFGPDTVICVGTSITLDAYNEGASYMWSDGSTAAQLTTFFEGEYFVEVTRDACTVRDTIYVEHGAVIYADFNYTQTTTCSPFTTEFNEFSQACSGSVVEWSWDFGDGETSTDRDPIHNFAAAGDYTVSLTVKKNTGASYTAQQVITIAGNMSPVVNLGTTLNLCEGSDVTLSAGNPGATFLWSTGETSSSITVFDGGEYSVIVSKDGCTTYDTVNVISIPVLWADFVNEKISDCLPVKYKFTDKSTACEGTITDWFWEFGDGSTSSVQNPVHEFSNDGQYAVKLTVTDNNGNTIRRSRKVTIESSTASVTLGTDTTICFGSSVTLDAGNPGYTYLWSTGETTQTISVFDDGEYTVTIEKNGCIAKDTVTVHTSASITTKWGFSRNGDCLPVTVNFTNSSLAYCGQTITGWEWEFGDGSTSFEQHPVHIYNSADSFQVRLTITTSNGSVSSKGIKVGIVNNVPALTLPDEMKVCTGEVAHLDAGLQDAQYIWWPAANVSSQTIANPLVKAKENTWIHVQANKCMAEVRDSVYVIVDSILKPSISQSGNNLTTRNSASYEWYRNGQKIGGANQGTLRIDRAGYYSVRVSNVSGCSRESDPAFFLPRSKKDKENEEVVIRCSPNPSHGMVNILFSKIPAKGAKLRVHDRYGRILFHLTIKDHVTPLNMLKLSKGLYFAEITIDNKKQVMPLVIQ